MFCSCSEEGEDVLRRRLVLIEPSSIINEDAVFFGESATKTKGPDFFKSEPFVVEFRGWLGLLEGYQ